MALKILIAAGGTGGHIYPALAMADAFKAERRDVDILFVGTAHGLENKIIPAKGYPVTHLPVGRLNSNVPLGERVKTVFSLPFAFLKSVSILRREKPDLVLGVGGHASGPLLLMASVLGYRTAIWEPNAMPGMANRILSKFVDECWVVFDAARAMLKNKNLEVAGMPIRREIEDMKPTSSGKNKFRLLVFGGSQGARGINNVMVEAVRSGGDWMNDIEIIHQTGAADFARIKEAYGVAIDKVDLREYLNDMGDQYAKADLVISRSGTGTLSELAACGKPAILIPFPFAADDHQTKNAESLVAKNAAILIHQKNLTADGLRSEILRLKNNPEELRAMSVAIRHFHQPRAAEKLVKHFVEKIEHASR
jgi:UDP-N-acetylglucosamine--N-acetylmuramyl-(pentapeptide) pyrophosphoryl-undecaprenol N-acetylglucosamine transferase